MKRRKNLMRNKQKRRESSGKARKVESGSGVLTSESKPHPPQSTDRKSETSGKSREGWWRPWFERDSDDIDSEDSEGVRDIKNSRDKSAFKGATIYEFDGKTHLTEKEMDWQYTKFPKMNVIWIQVGWTDSVLVQNSRRMVENSNTIRERNVRQFTL
jgi:hypothetical protein